MALHIRTQYNNLESRQDVQSLIYHLNHCYYLIHESGETLICCQISKSIKLYIIQIFSSLNLSYLSTTYSYQTRNHTSVIHTIQSNVSSAIIIRDRMKQLLRSKVLTYNYLQSFKKPVAEIPTSKPPKYIYQIEYHPAAMPNFEMGFKDHPHANPWLTIFEGEEDKYEFQYNGQWWEMASVTTRIFYFTLIVGSILLLQADAEERREKHLPGAFSHHRTSELSISHMATIDEA